MKIPALFFFVTTIHLAAYGQFVAKMEVKEPIPGLCSDGDVYVLFPSFKGQQQAVCPLTEAEILDKLNHEVRFLKDNPDHDDKGMIGLVINCKGEVVQCQMDNKTKTPELDSQIEDVFKALGNWRPGKLNRKEVDTSRLFSFSIRNGKISFD